VKRVTNKELVSKIEDIENKLPDGELELIHQNIKEIKEKLKIDKK
jgi:uncharacterized protein YfkK (UPF0435 family)|tara:strand:+ start:779 stop:913 length:135 start_codon:yes stop_codon:yes gene_type:complete